MRLFAVAGLFVFFYSDSYSQKNNTVKETEAFLAQTLFIVGTDHPAFDEALKEAIKNEWNVFAVGGHIEKKEWKAVRKSKDKSFAHPTVASWSESYNMNSHRSAAGIFFYQGGTDAAAEVKFATHVAYFGGWTGDNYDSAIYRLRLMIRSINSEYKYEKSKDSIQKIFKPSLLKKKKILLLSDTYFSDRKRDQVFEKNALANYPYTIKIASDAAISELISAKDNSYIFAVPIVNDATRMVFLYDVATGILVGKFARSGVFPLPIRSKDVESLVEMINTP